MLRRARESAAEDNEFSMRQQRRYSDEYSHDRGHDGQIDEDRLAGDESSLEDDNDSRIEKGEQGKGKKKEEKEGEGEEEEEEEEEEEYYGPELPVPEEYGQLKHSSGPTIPNLQDLELRRG